jgi:RNA polymerase sigma-70 factor (ECF subfamily)
MTRTPAASARPVSTALPPAQADVAPPMDEVAEERARIRAVLDGDTERFQELVEVHQDRVYRLALRMLNNEEDARDAAQDAFLKAYRQLASYQQEWRFKTWLMSITSNLCIDRIRRRRIEPLAFSDQPPNADGETPEVEIPSHDPGPDAQVAANEQRDVLNQMMAALPEEDRRMVHMFYVADMSYEEIVQATGASLSAVKSRLFRARRALAQSPLTKRLTV